MSGVSGNTPGLPVRGGGSAAAVVRRNVAWAILGLATVCGVVVMVAGLPRYPLELLPWLLVYGASVAVTSVILIRVPWHPLGLWLAIGSLITARDVFLPVLELQLASNAPPASIALSNLLLQWVSLLPTIGIAHVLGLFPDGEVHRRYESAALRLTWLILVIPVVLLTCSPTVITPLTILFIPQPYLSSPLLVGVNVTLTCLLSGSFVFTWYSSMTISFAHVSSLVRVMSRVTGLPYR